ncbi:MAG: hypothetical protein JSS30_02820 [Verrucomicrobia bacterium]|nr:hypothetical protein [Verrucomicrobiota bacterium]
MAQFTALDVEVLEEILYSSLRIPLSLLEQNLDLTSAELNQVLDKLSKTELFQVSQGFVIVDKDRRKYYEMQILKFEEDFKPGMEYLQGLLRKVPIHILPNWYSISRTSDNIFESIVEKYLHSPQAFQRYLMELHLNDPVQKGIMNAVYQSPDYEVEASDMIKKFNLSQEAFEEHMLYLEFSFVCCISYKRKGDRFVEMITPFFEWQEYLCHVRDTEPVSIIDEETIKRLRKSDFGVIEEMAAILELAQKGAITRSAIPSIQKKHPEFEASDFDRHVQKLCQLNLAERSGDKIFCTSDSLEWLKMKNADRAIYLYRHPLNSPTFPSLPQELNSQRLVREAEKSVARVVNAGWVYMDEFIKGIFIPLKESHHITLKKLGRNWKYQLPEYTEIEVDFFQAVISRSLFEAGITALGTKDGRDCFCLTPFGHTIFGNE